MAKMIRKRLVSLVIILFGLSILTFGLTYLLPSDPVEELITSMGGSHDPEIVEKLEKQYGTSRPFFVQYMDWIKGVSAARGFWDFRKVQQAGQRGDRTEASEYSKAGVHVVSYDGAHCFSAGYSFCGI